MTITLMARQEETAQFLSERPGAICTSDPGTGKTLAGVAAFARSNSGKGRLLVVAPASILGPSWRDDVLKYGGMTVDVATAANREAAFAGRADVVAVNPAGLSYIKDNPGALRGFTHLIADEFTDFKNPKAQRTKMLLKMRNNFQYIWGFSGTPMPRTVLDIWAPMKLIDGGTRLGADFYRYRNGVCTPMPVAPQNLHMEWKDKPEARAIVLRKLADVNIRFTSEECFDLPPNRLLRYSFQMPAKALAAYKKVRDDTVAELEGGNVSAVNAAVKLGKLRQLVTGAVYGDADKVSVFTERYELVMELAAQRNKCVIVFNWQHELQALKDMAEKSGVEYAEVHGGIPPGPRRDAQVEAFQNGTAKLIFVHPQAASHGLTLTAGTTTIWASAITRGDLFMQLNRRIHRKGQTLETETIQIVADGTEEARMYDVLLSERVANIANDLDMIRILYGSTGGNA